MLQTGEGGHLALTLFPGYCKKEMKKREKLAAKATVKTSSKKPKTDSSAKPGTESDSRHSAFVRQTFKAVVGASERQVRKAFSKHVSDLVKTSVSPDMWYQQLHHTESVHKKVVWGTAENETTGSTNPYLKSSGTTSDSAHRYPQLKRNSTRFKL